MSINVLKAKSKEKNKKLFKTIIRKGVKRFSENILNGVSILPR